MTWGAGKSCSRPPNVRVAGMSSTCLLVSQRAFGMMDLLVSITIIALLMGILLPSLSLVNESARKVACRSNIRQIGLTLGMYADDNKGILPHSVFLPSSISGTGIGSAANAVPAPAEMLMLRIPVNQKPTDSWVPWDGLGLLYWSGFMNAPKVYYCPSHRGLNPFSRFSSSWDLNAVSPIYGNYHYRGYGHMGFGRSRVATRYLYLIEPAATSLVADGMRTFADYNHRSGSNVFRADMSADWFDDTSGELSNMLSPNEESPSNVIDSAWDLLDRRYE